MTAKKKETQAFVEDIDSDLNESANETEYETETDNEEHGGVAFGGYVKDSAFKAWSVSRFGYQRLKSLAWVLTTAVATLVIPLALVVELDRINVEMQKQQKDQPQPADSPN